MATATIDHHARAERLRAMIDEAYHLNEDSLAEYGEFELDEQGNAALDARGFSIVKPESTIDLDAEIPRVPPRYAALTYDGRDSWMEFADTLDDMADVLTNAINGEVPWAPGEVLDLDTGDLFQANAAVTIHRPGER